MILAMFKKDSDSIRDVLKDVFDSLKPN